MPPQVNARLTGVTTATAARTMAREDWDQAAGVEPAGAGTVKWSGDAPAYYREATRFVPGAAGATVISERVLYVDSRVVREAGIDTDDVLSFTDPAGVARTARAIVIAVSELDGVPPELQTARLELADA
jgi:hypothetical protein